MHALVQVTREDNKKKCAVLPGNCMCINRCLGELDLIQELCALICGGVVIHFKLFIKAFCPQQGISFRKSGNPPGSAVAFKTNQDPPPVQPRSNDFYNNSLCQLVGPLLKKYDSLLKKTQVCADHLCMVKYKFRMRYTFE